MEGLDEDFTRLLNAWRADGDAEDGMHALEPFLPYIVETLRRLAARHLRSLGPAPTLQPTAVVNEAYLRLEQRFARGDQRFASRAHFFAFASKIIRDLLVDHIRRRGALKRGGTAESVGLDSVADSAAGTTLAPEAMLALHELLERLERRDPTRGRVVTLRFFGGLTMREISEVTRRSKASVERDWEVARRWLAHELDRPAGSRPKGHGASGV